MKTPKEPMTKMFVCSIVAARNAPDGGINIKHRAIACRCNTIEEARQAIQEKMNELFPLSEYIKTDMQEPYNILDERAWDNG